MKKILNEMIHHQRIKLLALARRLVPNLTPEDILQPQDYEALESNPEFRYEEGLLHGLEAVQAAMLFDCGGAAPFADGGHYLPIPETTNSL